MYELTFEDFERAEDFRWYLKENTSIDLGKARETSGGEPPTSYYEFESFGYSGFVMTMVYTICFCDGIDYNDMSRLPQGRKEKYLENQLFSHAIIDVKVWRPPSLRSREFRWVSENLGLSEKFIQNIVQRSEKRYYCWLKMETRYSLLIGLGFLILGVFFAFLSGPTSWQALLFFSFAAMLLVFCLAKTLQNRKKSRSRLPR
jgi:hypothetical protein